MNIHQKVEEPHIVNFDLFRRKLHFLSLSPLVPSWPRVYHPALGQHLHKMEMSGKGGRDTWAEPLATLPKYRHQCLCVKSWVFTCKGNSISNHRDCPGGKENARLSLFSRVHMLSLLLSFQLGCNEFWVACEFYVHLSPKCCEMEQKSAFRILPLERLEVCPNLSQARWDSNSVSEGWVMQRERFWTWMFPVRPNRVGEDWAPELSWTVDALPTSQGY